MKRLLLIGAFALAPTAAMADAPPPPAWQGVWQGTIGALPVRACLEQRADTYAIGSYYYLSRMKPLALQREDDGSWTEHEGGAEESSGRWSLAAQPDGGLTGQWRQGVKSLPIALTHLAMEADADSPCGSDAYSHPRLQPIRITQKPGRKGTFAYTEQTYDVGPNFADVTISSFTYPPSQPGDRAINAALRLDPGKREGEADYYACMRGQLGSLGIDGDYAFSYEPDVVTSEFISVQANDGGDCGGAHPSEAVWHQVYDRQSGKQVGIGSWFTRAALDTTDVGVNGPSFPITPAFRQQILRHAKFEDTECREAVSDADYWDVTIAERGMAFMPSLPHVVQACGDSYVVPFAELSRFLTPAGRAGFARLGYHGR